jgi:hypothetical protein
MPGKADTPEKLGQVPGKTKDISRLRAERLILTVQVVDVPPGGRVPEHHHGGPTIDFVLSGAVRMQLLDGPDLVNKSGSDDVRAHGLGASLAENLSLTAPAQIMLIHVHDVRRQAFPIFRLFPTGFWTSALSPKRHRLSMKSCCARRQRISAIR